MIIQTDPASTAFKECEPPSKPATRLLITSSAMTAPQSTFR